MKHLEEEDESMVLKTFDSEWNRLIELFEEKASGSTKAAGLAFLHKLHCLRQQWAACWTWAVVTLGIHSTQRAEAIHSAINKD